MDPSSSMAILSLCSRYGAQSFGMLLEYRYFPPSNPLLNDKFQIQNVEWNGMLWTFIVLPIEFCETAQKAAEQYGMALAEDIPELHSSDTKKRFPLPVRCARTFALINRERPTVRSIPFALESEQIRDIIKEAEKEHKADFSGGIQINAEIGPSIDAANRIFLQRGELFKDRF